jgi:hypothetical protein
MLRSLTARGERLPTIHRQSSHLRADTADAQHQRYHWRATSSDALTAASSHPPQGRAAGVVGEWRGPVSLIHVLHRNESCQSPDPPYGACTAWWQSAGTVIGRVTTPPAADKSAILTMSGLPGGRIVGRYRISSGGGRHEGIDWS